jgi:hypothetical protein
VSATASSTVKNLLILPPLSQGIVSTVRTGEAFRTLRLTAAHAMIESSNGKVDSNGLVSGLSRADLPAGRARSEHADGSGWIDPLNANYWRVR